MKRLAASCAAVVAAAGCDGGEPDRRAKPTAQPRIETVVQDDALMLHTSPREVRFWARQIAAQGADRVRITAGWAELAPRPRSRRRPRRFRAAEPGAYRGEGIEKLDRALRAVTREGLKPMVDIAFWAPRWAVTRGVPEPREQRWRPSPREFAALSEAMARRYNGDFRDLPAVRLWIT